MATGFSTDVIKVTSHDGWHFTVAEAFTYTSLAGEAYVVPVGATTDGASTPRLAWTETPPFGNYWMAAVLHDFLFRQSKLDEALCDSLLKEAMFALGVHTLLIDIIFNAVKLGGHSSFVADRATQATP